MNQSELSEEAAIHMAVDSGDVQALVRFAAGSVVARKTPATPVFFSLGLSGRVHLDGAAESACIEQWGQDVRIRLGPDFVKKNCLTYSDVGYLLLHEITHSRLGHIVFRPRVRRESEPLPEAFLHAVRNFSADMLVCRFLHERLGATPGIDRRVHGAHTPFWNVLVATPETLLGRSWQVGDHLALEEVQEAFYERAGSAEPPVPEESATALAEAYWRHWDSGKYTLVALTKSLKELLRPFVSVLTPPPLQLAAGTGVRVGARSARTDHVHLPDDLKRAIPADWTSSLGELRHGADVLGAGKGDRLEGLHFRGVDGTTVRRLADVLREYLRAASPRLLDRDDSDLTEPLSPILAGRIVRREAFWLSQGQAPLVYSLPVPEADSAEPIFCYVDVSGSTRSAWGPVIRALRVLVADGRRLETFQFSNKVVPLDVTSERVASTGGTDFDCVLDHMVECSCREVFVVTDGFAGAGAEQRKRAEARGCRVHLVLLREPRSFIRERLERAFGRTLAGVVSIPDGILQREQHWF